MSKAEYRYYELPQDLPLLVLTGEKWETIYGMDNMHFHNYLKNMPKWGKIFLKKFLYWIAA